VRFDKVPTPKISGTIASRSKRPEGFFGQSSYPARFFAIILEGQPDIWSTIMQQWLMLLVYRNTDAEMQFRKFGEFINFVSKPDFISVGRKENLCILNIEIYVVNLVLVE